jgi:hypothetical protein
MPIGLVLDWLQASAVRGWWLLEPWHSLNKKVSKMYDSTYTENFIFHKSSSIIQAEFYLQEKKLRYHKPPYTYNNAKFLLNRSWYSIINLMLSFWTPRRHMGNWRQIQSLLALALYWGEWLASPSGWFTRQKRTQNQSPGGWAGHFGEEISLDYAILAATNILF